MVTNNKPNKPNKPTDINRSDLARATGIDIAHISRIFNGKSRPSLGLALKIANHLGMTVEELCVMLGISVESSNDDNPQYSPRELQDLYI